MNTTPHSNSSGGEAPAPVAAPRSRRRQTGAFALRALQDIPELPAAYAESPMFGTLPATGLFARHCAGLVLESVALHHPADAPVPALATVNVAGLEGGLVQP
jgi:hypothetical protein